MSKSNAGLPSESLSHAQSGPQETKLIEVALRLPLILGAGRQNDADYLDSCRSKRNTVEYDAAGRTSAEEANELIDFCEGLRTDVLEWLRKKHPGLLPT